MASGHNNRTKPGNFSHQNAATRIVRIKPRQLQRHYHQDVDLGELELGRGFSPAARRRSRLLPEGAYLQLQIPRVHSGSGNRGTTLPVYSMSCRDRAASQAWGPGEMRTLRNKPSLCAFRNARSERAIWAGALCIESALSRNQYQTFL
jgi:hypothetical protein